MHRWATLSPAGILALFVTEISPTIYIFFYTGRLVTG